MLALGQREYFFGHFVFLLFTPGGVLVFVGGGLDVFDQSPAATLTKLR
jgi:hypothetical protein